MGSIPLLGPMAAPLPTPLSSLSQVPILHKAGAGVVHCASSNFMLKSGVCDVRDLLNEGLKVRRCMLSEGGTQASSETTRPPLCGDWGALATPQPRLAPSCLWAAHSVAPSRLPLPLPPSALQHATRGDRWAWSVF